MELQTIWEIFILQLRAYDGPLVTTDRVIGLEVPLPTSRYTEK